MDTEWRDVYPILLVGDLLVAGLSTQILTRCVWRRSLLHHPKSSIVSDGSGDTVRRLVGVGYHGLDA